MPPCRPTSSGSRAGSRRPRTSWTICTAPSAPARSARSPSPGERKLGVIGQTGGKRGCMPRRIDLRRAVLFAGSALLFISLFLEWYDTGPTGWQGFEALDLVLAAPAVAGLYAALRPHPIPPR